MSLESVASPFRQTGAPSPPAATSTLVLAHRVAEIGDPYFSPDGRTIFTSAMDQYLRIWRVPSWEGESGNVATK